MVHSSIPLKTFVIQTYFMFAYALIMIKSLRIELLPVDAVGLIVGQLHQQDVIQLGVVGGAGKQYNLSLDGWVLVLRKAFIYDQGLLILNKFHALFWCFYCWIRLSKCCLGNFNILQFFLDNALWDFKVFIFGIITKRSSLISSSIRYQELSWNWCFSENWNWCFSKVFCQTTTNRLQSSVTMFRR